jgi:hypothetical protein
MGDNHDGIVKRLRRIEGQVSGDARTAERSPPVDVRDGRWSALDEAVALRRRTSRLRGPASRAP